MSNQPIELNPGIYKLGEASILVAGPRDLFVKFPRKTTMYELENSIGQIKTHFPNMEVLVIRSDGETSFTPLGESQELRDLIRELVKEEIGPKHDR